MKVDRLGWKTCEKILEGVQRKMHGYEDISAEILPWTKMDFKDLEVGMTFRFHVKGERRWGDVRSPCIIAVSWGGYEEEVNDCGFLYYNSDVAERLSKGEKDIIPTRRTTRISDVIKEVVSALRACLTAVRLMK
jgi:hypothetical protein